jgi:hypothetical protein
VHSAPNKTDKQTRCSQLLVIGCIWPAATLPVVLQVFTGAQLIRRLSMRTTCATCRPTSEYRAACMCEGLGQDELL